MADAVLETFFAFAETELGLHVAEDRSWLDPGTGQAAALLVAADLAASAMRWSRADVLFSFGAWLDARIAKDGAVGRTRLLGALLALRQEMERWLCRRHAFANLGNRTPADRLTLQCQESSAFGDILHGLLVARLQREKARVRVERQSLSDLGGTRFYFHLERVTGDVAA